MPKVANWGARCHETVIVFAKIGEAISEVIGRTNASLYHGKVYIGAPNLDTVANFGGTRRFGSRQHTKTRRAAW